MLRINTMMVVCFQMNSAKINACTKLQLYYNITNVVPTQSLDVYFTFYELYASERFFNLSFFDIVVQKVCPSKIKGRAT